MFQFVSKIFIEHTHRAAKIMTVEQAFGTVPNIFGVVARGQLQLGEFCIGGAGLPRFGPRLLCDISAVRASHMRGLISKHGRP